MQDEIGDLIGDTFGEILSGFVDDLGFRGVRWGYQLVRFAVNAGRGDRQDSGQNGPEQILNGLVQTGKFEEAKKYIRTLSLPYSTENDVLRQIERVEGELQRACESEATVNRLLLQGKADEAIHFVEGLGLPYDRERHAVEAIRTVERQVEERRRETEERQRQIEQWNDHLNGLLRNGELRQAKKYVKSLPIAKDAKKAILAQL